jgi:hypothetical protein
VIYRAALGKYFRSSGTPQEAQLPLTRRLYAPLALAEDVLGLEAVYACRHSRRRGAAAFGRIAAARTVPCRPCRRPPSGRPVPRRTSAESRLGPATCLDSIKSLMFEDSEVGC